MLPTTVSPTHILSIPVAPMPPFSITWCVEGKTLSGHAVPGRAYLRAAEESFSCTSLAPWDGLFVSVDPKNIAWACDMLKVEGSRMLRSHLVGERDDQKLTELVFTLDECVQGKCINGSLYEEISLLAMSLQLVILYRADGRSLALSARASALTPKKLASVQDYIWSHLSQSMMLEDIAHHVHMSPFHLCRQFRKATSISLWQYVRYCRAAYARQLIARHPDMLLAEIANASGFESYSAFFNAFQKVHGISPSRRHF